MLYLVATPIGNRGDITFRAIEILKSSDYILCEDTRHSRPLLESYEIHKPLKSLHKFNEAARIDEILTSLKNGATVALISDAGTPGIADPGFKIVQSCLENDLPVFSIPGPCAAIAALTSSGLATDRFQFLGFLPRQKKELDLLLQELLTYKGTTICYESPHRLLKTLALLNEIAPERALVIAREITKKFEEYLRGTAFQLMQTLEKKSVKGEIVLLISACPPLKLEWPDLTPEQHVIQLELQLHLNRQEAIKAVAKLRGVSKRVIYNAIMR